MDDLPRQDYCSQSEQARSQDDLLDSFDSNIPMDLSSSIDSTQSDDSKLLPDITDMQAMELMTPFKYLEEPDDYKPENLIKYQTSCCNRCKRKFAQIGPKAYRMCSLCRSKQRQRSRKWQLKTRKKEGVCRRCGSKISKELTHFVLCAKCRRSLRARKAKRAKLGRCVHCSGPNNDSMGKYKVCKRCRLREKMKRAEIGKKYRPKDKSESGFVFGAMHSRSRSFSSSSTGCKPLEKRRRPLQGFPGLHYDSDSVISALEEEANDENVPISLMFDNDLIIPTFKNGKSNDIR